MAKDNKLSRKLLRDQQEDIAAIPNPILIESLEKLDKILDIDWSKSESTEHYSDMDFQTFIELAKTREIARDLKNQLNKREKKLLNQPESALRRRSKPGPKPVADEEKINIVLHYRQSHLTQKRYCELHAISKWELQTSIRWYRENFEIT